MEKKPALDAVLGAIASGGDGDATPEPDDPERPAASHPRLVVR
jgi:hypothetical protein